MGTSDECSRDDTVEKKNECDVRWSDYQMIKRIVRFFWMTLSLSHCKQDPKREPKSKRSQDFVDAAATNQSNNRKHTAWIIHSFSGCIGWWMSPAEVITIRRPLRTPRQRQSSRLHQISARSSWRHHNSVDSVPSVQSISDA